MFLSGACPKRRRINKNAQRARLTGGFCYYKDMHRKPVLFLDFDHTLFDTEQFYAWLGEDRFEKILGITSGKVDPPNFASYLYADTLPFLNTARKTHRLVLLTYSVNQMLQRRKVRDSGIVPLLDDVIISHRNKGLEAKEYITRIGDPGWEHGFVDDAPQNISDMKTENPDIRTFRIERRILPPDAFHGALCEADVVVKDLYELAKCIF